MNHIYSGMLLAATALVVGCSSASPNDQLTGTSATVAQFRPGTASATGLQHQTDSFSSEAAQKASAAFEGVSILSGSLPANTAIPTPIQAAALHSAGKIPYATVGNLLASRGVNTASKTAGSAGAIYSGAQISYGVAQYDVRLPETIVASTAAIAKLYDIYAAAAQELEADGGAALAASTACPGVALFDGSGNFTQDGVSCLIGKTATDDYVTVANTAVSDVVAGGGTAEQGRQIAIAAMLSGTQAWE